MRLITLNSYYIKWAESCL